MLAFSPFALRRCSTGRRTGSASSPENANTATLAPGVTAAISSFGGSLALGASLVLPAGLALGVALAFALLAGLARLAAASAIASDGAPVPARAVASTRPRQEIDRAKTLVPPDCAPQRAHD